MSLPKILVTIETGVMIKKNKIPKTSGFTILESKKPIFIQILLNGKSNELFTFVIKKVREAKKINK